MRDTFTSRDVRAGCFTCHGTDPKWMGPNAQGLAARHHDATKHATWCDINMLIHYGRNTADAQQLDIETAIAGA